MANFFKGNFLIFTISMFFMFSTAYTILFYYNEATGTAQEITALGAVEETTNIAGTQDSVISSITSGFLYWVLGILAIINPFGLLLTSLRFVMPSDIFQFLDLLLLRPIGWAGNFITANYVISRVRGVEE